MNITRSGAQPSAKGPAEWFTGTVRIDPLFAAHAPARAAGNAVTFEPSARTAWHTHPLGQVLIVTAGCGRVQREGGPIEQQHPIALTRQQHGGWRPGAARPDHDRVVHRISPFHQ